MPDPSAGATVPNSWGGVNSLVTIPNCRNGNGAQKTCLGQETSPKPKLRDEVRRELGSGFPENSFWLPEN